MYYLKRVTFIEQPVFTRLLVELVDDNVYRGFQNELAADPEKWPVVKGSGGLRKARLALPGRGKSGGPGSFTYGSRATKRLFFT